MKESAALLPLSEGYQQLQRLQKEVRGSYNLCNRTLSADCMLWRAAGLAAAGVWPG